MLSALIKKEFTDLWREDRIKWMSGFVLLLFAVSIATSYRYARHLEQEHAEAVQADREAWDKQPEKNPHGAAHFGFYIFKPVQPLSIFEPGVDRYMGAVNYLEAHIRNTEQYSAIADESDVARFGFLSPAFILQFLVPLLIIVAGFNSISREKENGNLSLLFSQGITSGRLFLGKWISLYLLVLCILIPVFLGGIVVLFVLNAGVYSFGAAMLMLLLYLLYYAVIVNIVLWISSRAKHSGRAFLYCTLFWIVSSILAPRLASSMAQQWSPLLTRQQITDKIREFNKERGENIHDLSGPAYKKLTDSLLKKYNVDSVNQLPVNMAGVRLDVGEQMDTRNYERITEEQLHRLTKQSRIITSAGLLSPLIPSQQVSMALSNTDIYSHHHFTDQGEQYRREFVNMMNRHIAYESGLQEGFTSFKAGRDLWKKVPHFQYRQPGLSSLSKYGYAVLMLFVWLIVSGWLLQKNINQFKPVK